MAKTKITVMVHEKLFQHFDKQMSNLHIKRDSFLDAMIQGEVRYLSDEMKGKRLSPEARRYVAGELKRLGTRKVNLQVEQSTADALNRVVKESNMVRDAFVNRLIMFLRSSTPILKHLELPYSVVNSAFDASVEPMPTSPLLAMESVHADPLYYIRTAIEERHETGLYLLDLPRGLVGFSCFLDDSHVPGTAAHQMAQEHVDAMLVDLETFENNVFSDAQQERTQP